MTDNAKAFGFNDLSWATERHFIDITPRKSPPFGLPESSEESYWDFDTGQKRLLRGSRYVYSAEGRLKKEEVFDANRSTAYTLAFEYDDHGNVTRETNALGEVIVKEYDANDNLVCQLGPAIYSIRNTYDFANRLIHQEEEHPDGKRFSTNHTYDYLSRCTMDICTRWAARQKNQ